MVQGWGKQRLGPGFKTGKNQRGVSLLLALVFAVAFGAILVTLTRFNSDSIRASEARVAGWEVVEVAKAARVYVRDQYIANPGTLRNTLSTPQPLYISTLRDEGYLSKSFGRGGDTTALGQTIYIVMANWSATGLGGDVNDNATVPTAFVILGPSQKSTANLMIQAVGKARNLGATINAPFLDLNGVNSSADCRSGGPAVGLWDTGCLREDEYATLASRVGAPTTFEPGALIVPAWKVTQPDMRAVMRVPQPENQGYATMLTDLQMGTPSGDCSLDANQVQIKTVDATGTNVTDVATGVCRVFDDDTTTDNRFGIDEVGNMTAERLIAEGQFADHGAETSRIGTSREDVMRVTGNVTLGADMRIFNTYNGGAMPTVQAGQDPVRGRFDIPNGSLTVERNVYAYSQDGSRHATATIETISSANALISDTLDADTLQSLDKGTKNSDPHINVVDTLTVGGNLSVIDVPGDPDPDAELIAEELNAPSSDFHATDTTGNVQVSNTLNLQGAPITVQGAAQAGTNDYTVISGAITDAALINVTGSTPAAADDLVFGGSVHSNSVRGYSSANVPIINTAACLENNNIAGACPERQYVPPNITP